MKLQFTSPQKIKSALRISTLAALLGLTGCASTLVPHTEYAVFKAAKADSGKEVQVKWVVRADAATYCASLLGLPNTAFQKPLACASWSDNRKTCTIVTQEELTHTIFGHELRHCFQGHFHGKPA